MDPTRRLPAELVEQRPRRSPTGRASRSRPGTPRRSCCCGRATACSGWPRGLPAAPARRHGLRRRHVRLPRRRRRQARLRRRHRLGRPVARTVGRAARHRRGVRPGAGVRRRVARRSRSRACCWPDRPRSPSSPTPRARTGRRTVARSRRARSRSPSSSSGAACELRTDLLRLWGSWVTPVFEPRRFDTRFFVAELPDGPGHPRRVDGVRQGACGCRSARRSRPSTARTMLMLPPTYCTCLEMFDFAAPAEALAERRGSRPAPRSSRRRVVDDDGAYLSIPDRLVRLGEDVAARMAPMTEPSWDGGVFGERARCVLAPNAEHDDARRHQHLGAARAGRVAASVVVDPGPRSPSTSTRSRRTPATVARRAPHARAPRPLRGGPDVRGADGLRGPRARPAAPARRGGARRRRRGRGRRPRGARRRHARATPRTRCRSCCPQERAVLTGDTVLGPGYDGRGAPRRPARRLPRLAAPAARPRRGAGGHRGLARSRPGHRRRARAPWTSTSRTARSGSSRSARRCARWRTSRHRRASRRTSCRARSSRPSTPTWTRCCGAPPSSVGARADRVPAGD